MTGALGESDGFAIVPDAAGALPAGADLDRAFRTWTVVVSGVVTQQLANAPGEPYETGAFTSTVPDVVAMWLAHHGSPHRGGGDPA
jgi:hypothetical protein